MVNTAKREPVEREANGYFKKGVSGNPSGKTLGSGKIQQRRAEAHRVLLAKEHEAFMLQRMRNVMQVLEETHARQNAEIEALISEYYAGDGAYPYFSLLKNKIRSTS